MLTITKAARETLTRIYPQRDVDDTSDKLKSSYLKEVRRGLERADILLLSYREVVSEAAYHRAATELKELKRDACRTPTCDLNVEALDLLLKRVLCQTYALAQAIYGQQGKIPAVRF